MLSISPNTVENVLGKMSQTHVRSHALHQENQRLIDVISCLRRMRDALEQILTN